MWVLKDRRASHHWRIPDPRPLLRTIVQSRAAALVCEYLEILPTLKRGVFVHVHDVFTPRDYPAIWVKDQVRFWNERYFVEAFLTGKRDFKIVGALNFLKHHHADAMKGRFPALAAEFDACEPASLWIARR